MSKSDGWVSLDSETIKVSKETDFVLAGRAGEADGAGGGGADHLLALRQRCHTLPSREKSDKRFASQRIRTRDVFRRKRAFAGSFRAVCVQNVRAKNGTSLAGAKSAQNSV